MIQKTAISVLNFNDRSVFVGVVIKNLEGERNYGQEALATCTFLRSHFCRAVAYCCLVGVNEQGVKSMVVLQKAETVIRTYTRGRFAHTN